MSILRLKQALSSTHHRWLFLPGDAFPCSLIELLAEKFPSYSKDSWSKRLDIGGAFINGSAVFADCRLTPPCCVEYFETRYDILKASDIFPRFSEQQIVYRDADLAVVAKPAGLPCFQAREQRYYNFRKQLEDYFRIDVHMPSRLDTSVCGLVLVSLSPSMHDKLQKLFERRALEKIYVLQSSTPVEWKTMKVDAAIERDPRHPILRRVVEIGGKKAHTDFESLQIIADQRHSFVAMPRTGRTHQIRLHAAHIGIAIVGDNFYGGAAASELHLASYAIRLVHPGNGEKLSISLPRNLQPEWLQSISAQLPIY